MVTFYDLSSRSLIWEKSLGSLGLAITCMKWLQPLANVPSSPIFPVIAWEFPMYVFINKQDQCFVGLHSPSQGHSCTAPTCLTHLSTSDYDLLHITLEITHFVEFTDPTGKRILANLQIFHRIFCSNRLPIPSAPILPSKTSAWKAGGAGLKNAALFL